MASLVIDIEARLAKFQDGLDAVQRDVGRAVGGLERSFARLGAGVAGLVAGAGAGSLAAAFKSTVDQLDAFNDASDRTGASVEELSSLLNTLSPYGGSLEQITDVAGLLTKAMRGAEEETSKAAGAFAALGVSTRDASGNFRPIQDVLEDVAKSLNEYADGTNKTALAQDILGKGAAQYMPLLKDLANAQRENATVTAEQAAAAERFNIEIGKIGRALDAFKVSLAGPLLTSLNNFIDQLRVGTDVAGGFLSALVKFGLATGSPESNIDRLTKKIADLNAQVAKDEALASGQGGAFGRGARSAAENRAKAARDEIAQALKDLQYFRLLQEQQGRGTNLRSPGLYDADGVRPAAPRNAAGNDDKAKISDGERLLKQLQDRVFSTLQLTEVEKLQADIARGSIKFDSDRQRIAALAAAEQIDSIKRIVDAEKERADEIKRATEAETADYQAIAKLNTRARDDVEKFVESLKDSVDPTRALYRELERVERILGEDPENLPLLNALRATTFGKVDEALSGIGKAAKETNDVARDLGLTFQSAFEDAIIEGEKFSTVLSSIAKDIARVFVRKAITEPLIGSLIGTSEGGGALTGGLFSGVLNAIGGKTAGASTKSGAQTLVINNDFRNSAMTEGFIAASVAKSVATTQATIYDDQVRGRGMPA